MKLLKRLSNGYRLIRYLLILCAIAYLWWEGESYVAAGILTVLMVGVPLWRFFRAEARDRQSVDCVSGGIRIENAAGSSHEISAGDVGGDIYRLGTVRSGRRAHHGGAVADQGCARRRTQRPLGAGSA